MSGEEEDSKAGAGEPEENAGPEMSDLFRSETAISWLDLRLDVAESISRTAASEDVVLAEDRDVRIIGSLTNIRGSRDVTVGGDYVRVVSDDGEGSHSLAKIAFWKDHAERQDIFAVSGTKVREVVRGGVRLHADFESEAIVGGGYSSQNVGVYLRISGMYDVMCWGGWTEVDAARTEVAGAAIKAYYTYTHAAATRVAGAHRYVDDFTTRAETFGVFHDYTSMAKELAGPGSGEIVEM